MPRTTKEETERRYRWLLDEQARSGLSLRAFADERGIAAGTLSYWKHELKRRDGARRQHPRRRGEESSPAFLPVKVIPAAEAFAAPSACAGGYEVLLGRDCVLRLPKDFEVARVVALMKAVASC